MSLAAAGAWHDLANSQSPCEAVSPSSDAGAAKRSAVASARRPRARESRPWSRSDRQSRGWPPSALGISGFASLDTAGGVDAAAGADPRPDDLRVQHHGRHLHRRPRRRRGDRVAAASRACANRSRPWRSASRCRAGLAAAAAALVDRGLLAVAEIVAQPDVTFSDVLARRRCSRWRCWRR